LFTGTVGIIIGFIILLDSISISMATAVPGTCAALPSKEAGLLRDVSKFYDEKQYKKGVKAADQVRVLLTAHFPLVALKYFADPTLRSWQNFRRTVTHWRSRGSVYTLWGRKKKHSILQKQVFDMQSSAWF
jgi:hypothetical protein